MPLPLAPIAGIALRYGTLAIATYAVAARIERGRRDQQAEDALDRLEEGMTLRREAGQMNATGRFRRVIRLGIGGPAVELDLASLARFRMRRVDWHG